VREEYELRGIGLSEGFLEIGERERERGRERERRERDIFITERESE
jgi:hypothetical protein